MSSLLLDLPFFLCAVQNGLLAGSPTADSQSDPYTSGQTRRRKTGLPFVFNDIPEREFRAPQEALSFAHRFTAGGLKS